MKPQLVAGTRDLAPLDVFRRNYIFDTIRQIYALYGFAPLETPAMERLDTLTGKYGTEGDTLLYKLLNSGDFLKDSKAEDLAARNSAKILPQIAEKGLRYDLTVPFARFVAMNRHLLPFPFKRYQIQAVWRAERNQAGRYREFFQCDADVVGSPALVYEAELMQIFDQVFQKLGLKVIIRINNRKLLDALAQKLGRGDQFMQITTIIDKLDKIGWEGITRELGSESVGMSADQIAQLRQILSASSLDEMANALADTERGAQGIAELRQVYALLKNYTFANRFELDPTLARGLNYYTGCIFEVVVDKTAEGQAELVMGSIASGGRYDNLTAIFGLPDVSGVGISFGADRIYDLLLKLKKFPDETFARTQALVLSLDEDSLLTGFGILTQLRAAGISADIYPQAAKFKKQLEYANRREVPFILIIGEQERTTGKFGLKNMRTGEQESLSIEEIIIRLQG